MSSKIWKYHRCRLRFYPGIYGFVVDKKPKNMEYDMWLVENVDPICQEIDRAQYTRFVACYIVSRYLKSTHRHLILYG